jgi:hypothetical protein
MEINHGIKWTSIRGPDQIIAIGYIPFFPERPPTIGKDETFDKIPSTQTRAAPLSCRTPRSSLAPSWTENSCDRPTHKGRRAERAQTRARSAASHTSAGMTGRPPLALTRATTMANWSASRSASPQSPGATLGTLHGLGIGRATTVGGASSAHDGVAPSSTSAAALISLAGLALPLLVARAGGSSLLRLLLPDGLA